MLLLEFKLLLFPSKLTVLGNLNISYFLKKNSNEEIVSLYLFWEFVCNWVSLNGFHDVWSMKNLNSYKFLFKYRILTGAKSKKTQIRIQLIQKRKLGKTTILLFRIFYETKKMYRRNNKKKKRILKIINIQNRMMPMRKKHSSCSAVAY